MTASATASSTAKLILRIIAVVAAAMGILFISTFISRYTGVLQMWARPDWSGIAIQLLLTLAGVAFGVYIIYLAYRLAFRPDRRVFKRVFFIAMIFLLVGVSAHLPLSAPYFLLCVSLAAAVGAFARAVLPFISKRLFRDDT